MGFPGTILTSLSDICGNLDWCKGYLDEKNVFLKTNFIKKVTGGYCSCKSEIQPDLTFLRIPLTQFERRQGKHIARVSSTSSVTNDLDSLKNVQKLYFCPFTELTRRAF